MSTYGHNSRHRGSAICAENTSPNTSSNNSHPRPYSHGQAEQLRRSRESTTFALIDNQLSKPPLNQVRDLYLQNRGSVNSSNSGPTRTTKKANLSAVHTIVRFRIKEYLYPLLAHYRRMLDTLFARIYPNYTPSMRDSLASQILGQSQLPCSLSCEFCERFKFQLDRHVSCRKMMLNKAALPSKLSSAKPSAGYYNSLNGDCYDGSANSCPISPNESVSRSRRYTLPPPIQPSTASTPLTSATAATSAKSCFVKPECSIDASSLSSPSSPRLNSEALDHNSESELLDDLQSVVDDGTPLAFHSSQRMLNDSSDVKRTRVDSATLRWHDLFDIPFNVDFNSMDDDNSLDLHSILNANSDLKIESFPDDTSTFPACDDVEGLSKFSLLENLARIDEGDSSISLKPEHLSPPQTPPRSFPCGGGLAQLCIEGFTPGFISRKVRSMPLTDGRLSVFKIRRRKWVGGLGLVSTGTLSKCPTRFLLNMGVTQLWEAFANFLTARSIKFADFQSNLTKDEWFGICEDLRYDAKNPTDLVGGELIRLQLWGKERSPLCQDAGLKCGQNLAICVNYIHPLYQSVGLHLITVPCDARCLHERGEPCVSNLEEKEEEEEEDGRTD
ncbi:unnamed protein product [Mesocestoides corti]|uniref:Uncharacterized protein n=1 Tax=Mesocestoides corti TaxID=53468 RepID=A0A0R3U587_MESCO|nr:unnamed protein product [Mesocestoides corti]